MKVDFRAFRAAPVAAMVRSSTLGTSVSGGPLRRPPQQAPGAGTLTTIALPWTGATAARRADLVFVCLVTHQNLGMQEIQ